MSGQKCTEVQSWKAAHLPTLEIRVEQKENRVMKCIGTKTTKVNVTVLGAETVDGPKKVKEGAVVVLLYWCYCFGCSDS